MLIARVMSPTTSSSLSSLSWSTPERLSRRVNLIRWERASATLASGTSKAVWELRSLTALGRSGPAGRDFPYRSPATPLIVGLYGSELKRVASHAAHPAAPARPWDERAGTGSTWRHPVNTSGIGADQPH